MKKSERKELALNNATFKKLQEVAEKHGYVCERACRTYYGSINISLYSKDRCQFRDYRCSLYLREDLDFTEKEDCLKGYTWEMSTTSYGSLSWEELEAYLNGIMESKAMYDELQGIDLRWLEKQLKEYDDEEESK